MKIKTQNKVHSWLTTKLSADIVEFKCGGPLATTGVLQKSGFSAKLNIWNSNEHSC